MRAPGHGEGMSRVNRSGVRVEPESNATHGDAYLLGMLEQWATEGRHRYRRRNLAIAVLRANGWKSRQIAEAFGIYQGRVRHLYANVKRSVARYAEPRKKG